PTHPRRRLRTRRGDQGRRRRRRVQLYRLRQLTGIGGGRASARPSQATSLTPYLPVMPSGWHPGNVEHQLDDPATQFLFLPAGQTATRLTQSPTHPLETPNPFTAPFRPCN